MSNQPGVPPRNGGGMATAALVLGIIAIIVPVLGALPGIVAVILGIVALAKGVQGKGKAIAGLVLGGISFLAMPLMALLIAILLPALGRARELSNRAYCMANLRVIGQSMQVYAVDNGDRLPAVRYAPYGAGNCGTSTATATGAATSDDAIRTMYDASSPAAGSPLSGEWILVLKNMVVPKQFICKSDPFATSTPAPVQSGSSFYTNFQADNQISYSFEYPWNPDGDIAGAWKNMTDSSLPVGADMTPLEGTGNPRRDFSPGYSGTTQAQNSANHQGEGQNVLFQDSHAQFVRTPNVGQMDDNIYTTHSGQPAHGPIILPDNTPPWDTVLVPVRNLDTGGL